MTILGTPYDAKMAKIKTIPAFPLVFAYVFKCPKLYVCAHKQTNKQTNKQMNKQTNKQNKQTGRFRQLQLLCCGSLPAGGQSEDSLFVCLLVSFFVCLFACAWNSL
jgi:uncharacterized membrane protein